MVNGQSYLLIKTRNDGLFHYKSLRLLHPKAYCPISLASFFLKTLERLIKKYIRDVILRNQPLDPINFHTTGRYTDTALHFHN